MCSIPFSFLFNKTVSDPRPVLDTFSVCLTGFLISLLTQLTHHYAHGLCHDADTQTTSIASYGESLGMMKSCLKHLNVSWSTHMPSNTQFLMFSFFHTQLRRWKWLIRNMRTSATVGTDGFRFNQNWLHIEKKLRHRRKQKWTQRYSFYKAQICMKYSCMLYVRCFIIYE